MNEMPGLENLKAVPLAGAVDLSGLKRAAAKPVKYIEKFQAMLMFPGQGMGITDLMDSYGDAVSAAKGSGCAAFEVKKLYIAENAGMRPMREVMSDADGRTAE